MQYWMEFVILAYTRMDGFNGVWRIVSNTSLLIQYKENALKKWIIVKVAIKKETIRNKVVINA